eukprot:COSAG02_NODE_49308_length_327_cov_1.355263_1_plen_46_part_10
MMNIEKMTVDSLADGLAVEVNKVLPPSVAEFRIVASRSCSKASYPT